MRKPRNKAAVFQHRQVSPRQTRSRLPTVLHIDDDPNDTELFQAATRRANVQFSVQNVADGEQAMAYLNGHGVFANRQAYPMPAVVLLDLKMPRATGFDVLRWIRAHPEAGNIPIIVFSGSELQDDIRQAYAVGADSYLVKPIGFNALVDLVKQIDHGWIAGYDGKAPTLSSPGRGTVWGGHLDWCGDNEARP